MHDTTVFRYTEAKFMKRLFACLLFSSAAIGVGCSEGDDTDGAGGGNADFDSSYREYIEASCSCEDYRNGASEEDCVEARFEESGTLTPCQEEILSRPEAADTVQCISEATLVEADCIAEDPCNSEHKEACYVDHDEATAGCGLPSSLSEDFEACPPRESFRCLDGGSVDIDVVCDLVNDCEDGSDEIPC